MNFINLIKSSIAFFRRKCEYFKSKQRNNLFSKDIEIQEISKNYISRNDQYLYFHHYFWNLAPKWLREHRSYFKQNKRGFGEDAFHAMWYKLLTDYKPFYMLEIGVYRGQCISLWQYIADKMQMSTEIHGVSPFKSFGDSVSTYIDTINYYEDVILNCKKFSKNLPLLHTGLSTDFNIKEEVCKTKWDLIYIDGNHEYHVVKEDFETYSKSLKKNGLLIFDDSALYTDYTPYTFSSKGHPGPSKLVEEIDVNMFCEVLSVGHNRIFKKIK